MSIFLTSDGSCFGVGRHSLRIKKSRRLCARGFKFSSWCRSHLQEGTRKPATGFAIAKEKPKIKVGFKRSRFGKDCVHGVSDFLYKFVKFDTEA